MKPQIVLRLILWLGINTIPVAIGWFQNINMQLQEGKEPMLHWSTWWLFGLQLALSTFTAWRMYLDGSAEKARQQTAAESKSTP